MRHVTLDQVNIALAVLLHAGLALLLLRKGLARRFPIFLCYLILNIFEDPLFYAFQGRSPMFYMRYYYGVTILDYVLQLLILFEIGWSVLRPSRRSLPFPIAPFALVALLGCTIVAAMFAPRVELSGFRHVSEIFVRMTLLLAVLRLLLFAALAFFAQFFGIGWKNHTLQLSSGLAFFGAVSLLVQLGIHRLATADQASYLYHYAKLTQVQTVAYLGTLAFWIWSFSRNEEPSKDFTPQMQQVLVTIAESAKRTRLAVTRSSDRR